MVEGTGFENRHGGNSIEGSNPSLSANLQFQRFDDFLFRSAPPVRKTSKNVEIVNRRYLLVEILTFFEQNPD